MSTIADESLSYTCKTAEASRDSSSDKVAKPWMPSENSICNLSSVMKIFIALIEGAVTVLQLTWQAEIWMGGVGSSY